MSRTSTSIGMGVTVTLLSVLLLATFVVSIIFYGQKQRAEKDLAQFRASSQDIIAGEDKTDWVQALVTQAKAERKSGLRYLHDSLQTSMRSVTGNERDTAKQLQDKLAAIEGASSAPLLRVLGQRDTEIQRLHGSLAEAQASLDAASEGRAADVARLEQLQKDHLTTIESLRTELARFSSEVDRNRDMVQSTLSTNNTRVDEIRSGAAQVESNLRQQIGDLQETVRLQQDTIDQLRLSQAADVLKPADEASLADARVVATDAANRTVVLDVGRGSRVVLGMTFAAYSDSSAIRPDSTGAYPEGKANLEVVRIDENSSVARIVSERRGNPVVVGDVVANAVYDPNKAYTFVVFGNFDSDRDGIATPQERNGIIGLLSAWGGRMEPDITGRTDFLVLGERPVLPPQPPADAPIQVIQEYIRKQKDAQDYDRLFQTAIQTGIPVLNENRLYTLTGQTGSR